MSYSRDETTTRAAISIYLRMNRQTKHRIKAMLYVQMVLGVVSGIAGYKCMERIVIHGMESVPTFWSPLLIISSSSLVWLKKDARHYGNTIRRL